MMAGLAVLVEQYLGKQSRAAVRGRISTQEVQYYWCIAAAGNPGYYCVACNNHAWCWLVHSVVRCVTMLCHGRHQSQLRPQATHLTQVLLLCCCALQLFRTWGSVLAMLPIGGPKVWGNATFAPDDDPQITAAGRSYG